jgi:hypothetical protein
MKDSKVLRWDWAFGLSCSEARVAGSLAGVTGSELGFKVFLSFWIPAISLSSLDWARSAAFFACFLACFFFATEELDDDDGMMETQKKRKN